MEEKESERSDDIATMSAGSMSSESLCLFPSYATGRPMPLSACSSISIAFMGGVKYFEYGAEVGFHGEETSNGISDIGPASELERNGRSGP